MTDCVFCNIAAGEIGSKKVFENDTVMAFEDIAPQAPVHILVIPKKHFSSITAVSSKDAGIFKDIFLAINEIAKDKGLIEPGFRVVANHGKQAGQAVLHIHFHILGKRNMNWPPG